MTAPPTPPPAAPPPLQYESPPATPRAAVFTVIAWLVILACAAYIITTTAIEKNAGPPASRRTADVGFRIASRYAVGAHHTISAFGGGADTSQSLLPQVDAAATGRDEKIEAAIVAGEIGGSDAAFKRLDKVPAEAPPGEDLDALRALYAAGNAAALTPTQRQALRDRHGWFGELALSFGLAADDASRQAALRPAVRTAVLMMLAFLIAILALVVGFAALITAIVLWTTGKLGHGYQPPRGPTGPFLEAFAAYMAGMVGLGALARLLLGERLVATWFVIAILPFVFFWPLLRGVNRAELRAGLGWHRGRGFWWEVGAGIVGYFAGLPVLAVGGLISLLLQRFSGSDTSHPIINELGGNGWQTFRLFLLASVWAPIVEETMFRGALFHHLRARLPWPAAAALVAVLFAAVHPQGWAAIPVLGAIAFSFATIREWRGSIIAPAVAHALNNGAVTLLLVLLLA